MGLTNHVLSSERLWHYGGEVENESASDSKEHYQHVFSVDHYAEEQLEMIRVSSSLLYSTSPWQNTCITWRTHASPNMSKI